MIKLEYKNEIYFFSKDKIIDIYCCCEDDNYSISIDLIGVERTFLDINPICFNFTSYDEYKYILNQLDRSCLNNENKK